ncbi:hypothetical protein AUK40_04150 [Candidatus Wirthbacteria bacterium CG2_30_54_11]|uniref:AI-2E family transporter n=1 Tax=Candidatus Wirthbacteria bacterium CG2_30_54_11 TaxID=1817892 RepID=A0A1J5IIP9_9BACT|nr:MAG: hypothetical protein AUK40_04150 [Candidatus Wirthbacteria bacterium CG2_30_54_11]
MANRESQKKAFYFVFLICALLLFWVFRPYISMVVLAVITTMLFDPIYKKILKAVKGRKGIAAFVSTFLVLLSFVIPLFFVTVIAAEQAIAFANSVQRYIASGALSVDMVKESLQRIIDRLPQSVNWDAAISAVKLEQIGTTASTNFANYVSNVVLSVLQNGLKILTDVTFFLFIIFYLFQDRDFFFKKLIELSPLEDDEDRLFIHRFESMAKSILKGSMFIAFVQGALGGLMFYLLGIPSAVFWTMLMCFLALLPLGSGLVWIPASIILIVSGSWVRGVILFAFGEAIIATIDNVIRAKLLQHEESHLHPLITLLSVIGGIKAFGFIGFVYGPLIAMLFLTSLQLYRERLKALR